MHVPLYPRQDVAPVCRKAVEGRILLPDTVNWQGIRGQVIVALDSLEMGSRMRDDFAYNTIFQTARYPSARYTIDSVVGLTRHGDTLVGTAVGVVSIRGVNEPTTAAIQAWHDVGGMRVLARLRVTAASLEEEFGMSKIALSLGVGTNLWRDLFMGVDMLLRPDPPGGN